MLALHRLPLLFLAGVAALVLAAQSGATPLRAGDLLVVTDYGELHAVDPATGASELFAQVPGAAGSHLAFDGAGDVLVRNRLTGAAYRVDRDTADVTLLASGGFLDDGSGIAFHPDGILLDALVFVPPSSSRARVVRVEEGGGQSLVSEAAGYFPQGIAIDAEGSIFLISPEFVSGGTLYRGVVLRIDPATGGPTLLTSGGNLDQPLDIEVAADGTLVVLDRLGRSCSSTRRRARSRSRVAPSPSRAAWRPTARAASI